MLVDNNLKVVSAVYRKIGNVWRVCSVDLRFVIEAWAGELWLGHQTKIFRCWAHVMSIFKLERSVRWPDKR